METHSYLPPIEFLQAATTCPPLDSPEYREALRRSNANQAPPLLTIEDEEAAMWAKYPRLRGSEA
jgi:hypothetical protein